MANPNFVKRNPVSTLFVMSAIGITAGITDVMSSPLAITAVIHETVIPTSLDPSSRCTSPYEGIITGNGTSPLLGKVSFEASDCITPVDNYFSFDGKMVLTVSSGDQIFAEYHGLFIPTSYPSIYTISNPTPNIPPLTIDGGTGNFKNAKGSGNLLGGEDLQSGWGVMQVSGTISNFKTSKDYSSPVTAYQLITGTANDPISAIAELNNNLISNPTTTLGHYFQYDQSGLLLAENPLPEASSWALLGIGLASLAATRRRKPEPSSS
jgi:hypothetical protein